MKNYISSNNDAHNLCYNLLNILSNKYMGKKRKWTLFYYMLLYTARCDKKILIF